MLGDVGVLRALCWVCFAGGAASLPHPSLFLPLLLQEPLESGSVEEAPQELAPQAPPMFYLNPLYDPSETET